VLRRPLNWTLVQSGLRREALELQIDAMRRIGANQRAGTISAKGCIAGRQFDSAQCAQIAQQSPQIPLRRLPLASRQSR
jgi:hypothetical protein